MELYNDLKFDHLYTPVQKLVTSYSAPQQKIELIIAAKEQIFMQTKFILMLRVFNKKTTG